jgi:hypothetical protein
VRRDAVHLWPQGAAPCFDVHFEDCLQSCGMKLAWTRGKLAVLAAKIFVILTQGPLASLSNFNADCLLTQ